MLAYALTRLLTPKKDPQAPAHPCTLTRHLRLMRGAWEPDVNCPAPLPQAPHSHRSVSPRLSPSPHATETAQVKVTDHLGVKYSSHSQPPSSRLHRASPSSSWELGPYEDFYPQTCLASLLPLRLDLDSSLPHSHPSWAASSTLSPVSSRGLPRAPDSGSSCL